MCFWLGFRGERAGKFESIEPFHVAMPLNEAWRTARSEETAIQSALVRMVADGQEGWAKVVADQP